MAEQTQATPAHAPEKPAERPLHPYEHLSRQLEMHRDEFAKLLGPEVPVERFVRTAKNAILANPELLEVDRASLIQACMRAAADRLLPDGKEAVINIYRVRDKSSPGAPRIATAKYLPMVGGLIKKLYQSEHVTYIDAVAVYEADQFHYQRGDEPRITHVPSGVAEPGPIVAAYAIVKLKNGETKREVMWARDLDQVREASRSGDDGPWVTWPDQMAIKSVLKRVYKQLPSHEGIDAIVASDNAAMGFVGIQNAPNEERGTKGGVAGLKSAMAATRPALEDKPGEHLEQTAVARESAAIDARPSNPGEKPEAAAAAEPSGPSDDEAVALRRLEWIEGLADQRSEEALAGYAESVPSAIRGHNDFAKAFKRRLDELKTKAK